MTHDYKSDRERLEKTLTSMQSITDKRQGVNDFLEMLLVAFGDGTYINRGDVDNLAQEYARKYPLSGEL